MKKYLLIPVILSVTILGFGQRSVDALFDRYNGSNGFTSITISGNLIKLFRTLDRDKSDDDGCWPSDITTVRILTHDDDMLFNGNFYDMVERELDNWNYEEFMRVKNIHQEMVMLVKANGRKLKEFLIVAGGRDNFLMQIKGNMTYEEAKRFSKSIKNDNGINIVISCK